MKWPFLILLLLAVVLIPRKPRKAVAKFCTELVRNRDVSLAAGQFSLSLSRVEQELAEATGDLDATMPVPRVGMLGESESEPSPGLSLSREAVERIVRASAELGWTAARAGFTNPPAPTIDWSDAGNPTVDYCGVYDPAQADLRD